MSHQQQRAHEVAPAERAQTKAFRLLTREGQAESDVDGGGGTRPIAQHLVLSIAVVVRASQHPDLEPCAALDQRHKVIMADGPASRRKR